MRWWKVGLTLAGIGSMVGLLAYGFTVDPRAIPSTLTGRPAPDFSLTLFDGHSIQLSDFRGKVVFLNFWASWCPPCRVFSPVFEAASDGHPDIVFGKVNTEEEPELAEELRIRAIPTVLAFKEGKLVLAQPGFLSPAVLEAFIEKVRALDLDLARAGTTDGMEARS